MNWSLPSPAVSLSMALPQSVMLLGRATVFAIFMALAAAFNSDRIILGSRLVYWISLTAIAFLIRIAVARRFERNGAGCAGTERLFSAITVALIMTPVVWMANWIAFAVPLEGGELIALAPSVGFVAVTLELLMPPARGRQIPPQTEADVPPPGSALTEMLPLPIRGAELYALKAEDHYVRVHTSSGSALIRARFNEAVLNTRIEGIQTHRSWWVNSSAIRKVVRIGGRHRLILEGGLEVPVSRSAARELGKAALGS